MSKDKKPILFDDIEWGNQELPNLSHDEIMDEKWTRKWDSARKNAHSRKTKEWYDQNGDVFAKKISQSNKDAVPNVIAISPEGEKHTFASLSEAEQYLNCGPLFNCVPADGMPYRGERQQKKNWIFFRDIPNKQRNKELAKLKQIVKSKTAKKTLTQPWRSSVWRTQTAEGKAYMKALHKKRNAPKVKKKKVKTPDGIFNSNKEAANFYNISTSSFHSRKIYNPDTYYNCDENGNKLPK